MIHVGPHSSAESPQSGVVTGGVLSARYPDAHLRLSPTTRVIVQERIIACLHPAHAGRDMIDGQWVASRVLSLPRNLVSVRVDMHKI